MDQDVSAFAASTSSPEPGTRGASPRVGFSCKTFVTSESGCFETGTSVSADAELGGSQANHWQPRKRQRMEKGQETWRVGKRLDTAAKRRRASLIFRMFGNLFPLRSTTRAQCACTSKFVVSERIATRDSLWGVALFIRLTATFIRNGEPSVNRKVYTLSKRLYSILNV